MKKATITEIKDFASLHGFEVLSDEYANCKDPLLFKCTKGHIFKILWSSFKHKPTCAQCKNCNIKFTYDYVKSYFNQYGYVLISKEYHNISEKLDVICPVGHHTQMTLNNFKNNKRRCKFCAGNVTLPIEYIKKEASKEGYSILDNTYHNNHEQLNCICPEGHVIKIQWKHFQEGIRCPICFGKEKLAQQKVEQIFKEHGCKLLGKYKNYDTKVKYQCSCGNVAYGYIGNIRKDIKCGCGRTSNSGENSPHWNPNKTQEERISQRGYPEYYDWRKSIFKRDDYNCQCCGKHGHRLNAHHLYNYSDHKDLRIDINNGITLCKECHKKYHSIYSVRNNTPQQFLEFTQKYYPESYDKVNKLIKYNTNDIKELEII